MTLLLKQLDIHGFKSFATPTTFVFDKGITAVIGPNGSGKSNVAEALRWVLGEQGYSNLRSRRTEDVIFAGSDKRAQHSMAEVVLTLDNHDGDLPLQFSEITVTRRAFRSGESQYLINGGRVRLKDIQQLVAPLGQSYTIIGQGLVDAALSQRPEERRGLFEHAAGISGLRMRANEAERSLAESTGNAQRLRDILSELEPRVRSLERSARLAREYGNVRDRLVELQRRHYGYLWEQSLAKLAATRAALHAAARTHQELESRHADASRRLGELRGEERRLATEQRQRADELIEHERAIANARHQHALLEERIRASHERRDDLQQRVEELEHEQAEFSDEAGRHDRASDEIRARLNDVEMQLAEHTRTADAARQRRSDLRAAIEAVEARLVTIRRELAEIEGTQAAVSDRLATVAADRERSAAQSAGEREQISTFQQRIIELDNQIAQIVERQEAIQAAIVDGQTRAATAGEGLAAQRASLQTIERELTSLQTRLDALERSHASGEGLYAGVRAILRAINRGQLSLPGLIGALAETVEVPTKLETAIEVALGGHLQDLIVHAWSDAQEAIAYLKRTNAGRATFQPLDTVRPGRRPALPVRDNDLLGVAADLVSFPEHVALVVEQLLGRTLVVTDLDATRRVLTSASGWTIVTLSGEITRPSGSVTGGGRAAEAGILARERERRSLPGTIAARSAERTDLQAAIDRTVAAIEDGEANRRTNLAELDAVGRQLRDLQAARDQQCRNRESAEAALRQADSRAEDLDQREQRLRQEASTLERRTADLGVEQQEIQQERTRVEAILAAEPEDVDSAAAGLRVELAAAQERLRTAETSAGRARQRASAAQRAASERVAEIARLAGAETSETQRLDELSVQILEIETHVATSQAAIPPIASQRDEVIELLATAERVLSREADALREAERERDRDSLNLARVQDEQVFLVERIRSDLELEDPSELEISETDAAIPDEQEINRLRDRLRRMSNVGEDVLEQYETESQRLAYLSGQLADIDEASDGLRRVLAELNGKMATRFSETFRDVAVAFEHTFTRLFGGGSARLVMNASEDGAAGIDIVAQPPGKRLQNLNALSGGERALTAVALLIAIQRVNPSPFCLLDEVDAALDESNVVRFRDELRELAGNTQYVVITHNRGTIEGADTLYGVTMGDDGVSRVLSLRLEEAIRAVEEYESAQPAST